jgi:hypothetical protein
LNLFRFRKHLKILKISQILFWFWGKRSVLRGVEVPDLMGCGPSNCCGSEVCGVVEWRILPRSSGGKKQEFIVWGGNCSNFPVLGLVETNFFSNWQKVGGRWPPWMLHSQCINVSVYTLVFLKLKKRGDFSKGPIINAIEIYTYLPITAGKQSPFSIVLYN